MLPPREVKMKKVLMIANVFPPFKSVGHSIRVVKFIKFLPASGWLPVVLTIDDKKEYQSMPRVGSESLLPDIQPEVKIHRTAAGEPSSEFLEKERKFGQRNWLAAVVVKTLGAARRWSFRNIVLPDLNMVWLPFALRKGVQIVREEGIDVIFVTCPPFSVSLIGMLLKLLTGKPLILDFRDDWMDTPNYESKPKISRMIERTMERWAVRTADRVIVVTEWSKSAFLKRYPSQSKDKFVLIPNGCDLNEFAALNSMPTGQNDSKFTILHTGSLNESKAWARRPAAFFQALQGILQRQPELREKLTVSFTGFLPEGQKQLVGSLGLSDVVNELGFLPRDEWLRSMKAAGLLLVINYEGFSTLIPGKIYEYWAVGGPPILLLSSPGAASSFIQTHELGLTVDFSDSNGIQQAILTVYRQSRTAAPMRLSRSGIEAFDRQVLTRQLADVLSTVSAGTDGNIDPIKTLAV